MTQLTPGTVASESQGLPSALRRPRPATSAIVVVDVQEKLSAAMPPERLADLRRSARILLGAAKELRIPVLFTEQYPKGLGPTDAELAAGLAEIGARRFEKLAFSACGADGFVDALPAGVETVVVIGMETHVCVFQTVRDLVSRGLVVAVPLDGVCSRRDDHRQAGLDLCARAGAVVTTTEGLVFDWLERAGSDSFKVVSKLVR